MAKIKDIRKWGFPEGSANESGHNPFLPIFKKLLKAVGVGYKDPCCPDETGTCSDPCGYIQTISTDNQSTISISGLDGAPGNTIDLKALVDYSETVTEVTDFSLAGNIISISYKDEDGVTKTKSVDLSTIVPNLEIRNGSYDDATNTINFVTADGTIVQVLVNELTIFTSTIASQANKHQIGTYQDENEVITPVYETVTTVAVDPVTGILTFTDESGAANTFDLSAIVSDCCITGGTYNQATGEVTFSTAGGGSVGPIKTESLTSLSFAGTSLTYKDETGTDRVIDLSGLLAAATTNVLSNPSGANITSTVNGVVSNTLDITNAVKAAETNISVADTNPATNKKEIATITNEDGTVYSIKESVTSFDAVANPATGKLTLSFTDELGNTTTKEIDICAFVASATCVPASTVFPLGFNTADAGEACSDAP